MIRSTIPHPPRRNSVEERELFWTIWNDSGNDSDTDISAYFRLLNTLPHILASILTVIGRFPPVKLWFEWYNTFYIRGWVCKVFVRYLLQSEEKDPGQILDFAKSELKRIFYLSRNPRLKRGKYTKEIRWFHCAWNGDFICFLSICHMFVVHFRAIWRISFE